MFGSGTFHYDHALQGPHYYGSLHRWFRELRVQAAGDRQTWLRDRFKDAQSAQAAIDAQPPTTARLTTRHLREWEGQLLR
jgi:hypothetical protein